MSKNNSDNSKVINLQSHRELKKKSTPQPNNNSSFAEDLERLAFEPYEVWGNKLHAALGLPPLTEEQIKTHYEIEKLLKHD